jgi:hypothetical protein
VWPLEETNGWVIVHEAHLGLESEQRQAQEDSESD